MTQEEKILLSFIEEKAEQCASNQMITSSRFLDMHEMSLVNSMRLPYSVKRIFYGGFDGTERNIAVFLPEYIEAKTTEELTGFFISSPDDCPVSVLEIKKDRFSKELTHRDYLGALMGLGINRDMTGDILVGESGAHIAVIGSMAKYIADNMGSAGRGTLTINIVNPWDATDIQRDEGIPDSFTVSSPRLDSVVKNGFNISRDSACEAISRGLVFVNDTECSKPDKRIGEGDKIAFRHHGRIIVTSIPGKSKKGRDIINITRFINQKKHR